MLGTEERGVPVHGPRRPDGEPVGHPYERAGVDPDGAALPLLPAQDADRSARGVHVLGPQHDRFGDAESAAVADGEKGGRGIQGNRGDDRTSYINN